MEHGLDQRERQTFASRWQHQGMTVLPDGPRRVRVAGEHDALQVVEGRHRAQPLFVVAGAVEPHLDRALAPSWLGQHANQQVLSLLPGVESRQAGQHDLSVVGRPGRRRVIQACVERVAHDLSPREGEAELFLGQSAVVLGDEQRGCRIAIDLAQLVEHLVAGPVQVGRLLADHHVGKAASPAQGAHPRAVVVQALADDDQGRAPARELAGHAPCHPGQRQRPHDCHQPPRRQGQPVRPLQVDDARARSAHLDDASVGGMDTLLEREDLHAASCQLDGREAPQFLAAAPHVVAAGEGDRRVWGVVWGEGHVVVLSRLCRRALRRARVIPLPWSRRDPCRAGWRQVRFPEAISARRWSQPGNAGG